VYLTETELDIPPAPSGVGLLEWLTRQMAEGLPAGHSPLRLAVTETSEQGYRCEATTLEHTRAPSSTTAAAVSSQDVSIPRMRTDCSRLPIEYPSLLFHQFVFNLRRSSS